jgi:glucan phosphoethanolaminetransferase (alkaline phosphatase superfamily)
LIAFSILLTLLPIVLIVFIIGIAVKNKEGGGENMFRHLYIYLVLFATLMMVIGGGISIFMATADLVNPPAYYQSFQDFKDMKQSGKDGQNETNLSEEELRSQYEQMVKDEKARQQNNAKNQIIKSLGFIVIPLPIFLYFNRMRKKGEPA